MGFCGGGATTAIDPSVERKSAQCLRKMKEDFLQAETKKKLLLLGAGESGKSTVFKQMRIINASGYTSGELRQFRRIIHRNILDGIKALLDAAQNWGLELSESNEELADALLLHDGDSINPELGSSILSIIADAAIVQCLERKDEFQLGDGVRYFLSHVDRISTIDYVPTTEDALRARVRTTGVIAKDFEIKGRPFQMYDVGGQRSERRHWLQLFDNVTAIVFVAAISEYNQVVAEDRSKNRILEALELFEQIVNSKYFAGIDVLLFLNKKDLFYEKIQTIDPITWFPDYTGGCDAEKAEAYFRSKFANCIIDKSKGLFTYTTCATDTSNMMVVFNAVESVFLSDAVDGLAVM